VRTLGDVRVFETLRIGRKPAVWTRVDRDYETPRIGMQTLFHDLGITPVTLAAA
jgi:hypothetical protein